MSSVILRNKTPRFGSFVTIRLCLTLAERFEGARQRAIDEFRRLRALGTKGVTRYTDQVGNKMIYCVSWPTSEESRQAEEISKNILTEAEELGRMADEGGNQNDR
jgi:hypothetical protein